jgi:hypothetical protein
MKEFVYFKKTIKETKEEHKKNLKQINIEHLKELQKIKKENKILTETLLSEKDKELKLAN